MTDVKPEAETQLVTITIDGVEHEVKKSELLIKAAQENGTYIPRFCWHPRMNAVGMCRMCLVQIETPRGPALITACTNPVADGMVVDTQNDTVKKAQEGILEFLLINHPLDCPVCDRGGECPLQDQTMSYGPGESRFVEEKRHYEKPIPISDLVLLDRERCILCARCTRFSDEISGDPLIEFKDRGNNTQVNTFPDLPFSSYFSGNTVQICPVGALTATAYRFRARPWDLGAVESTCAHCTAGDRITIQSSQNEVLRFLGVDAEATNHGWLSDKCRFGFEYINSPDRLSVPLVKGSDGQFRETSWAEALDLVASKLKSTIEAFGPDSVGAIGGARLTNEDAYALSKFMRVAVGTNNLDAQLDDGLDPQFLAATADRGLISDLETAKTMLVWGPDLKEEHPTLYLRVRRAAQELGATLIVIHPRATGLDDRAGHKFTYRPGAGSEVLTALSGGEGRFASARAALDAGPVVALIGRTGYTEDPKLAEAVAAFVRSLPDASILPLARRSNVFGALDMGLAPTLLPGRVSITGVGCANLEENWGGWPKTPGKSTREMLTAGALEALLLIGADPVRDMPDGSSATDAIESAGFVVAIDQFLTDSSRLADVILPAEGFAEKAGTVTNIEGRVQKVNNIVPGPGQSRPDWSIIDDIATRMGASLGFASAEGINAEIAHVAPAYEGVTWDLLEWDERDGVVVPHGDAGQPLEYIPVDTGGKTIKGDLVLHHARVMYDDGVLMRNGLSQHDLAPGASLHVHPDDAARLSLTERATLTAGDVSVTLPVVVDDSLAHGVVYVPFNQPDTPPLGSDPVVEVRSAD
ncbi:MAG: NADH-quinone oxidoreductase subunit NuoG [Acidimicrobiia bacterium]|nr:NADH-quinone oxidoreductase subunit NuoG [Acidimicrobiia bacterium]